MSSSYHKRERRSESSRDELDSAVLRELLLRSDVMRAHYGMVTGPFSIQASNLAFVLRHSMHDRAISGHVVAAALKRLRRIGLAGYCDVGKGWFPASPRDNVVQFKPKQ